MRKYLLSHCKACLPLILDLDKFSYLLERLEETAERKSGQVFLDLFDLSSSKL